MSLPSQIGRYRVLKALGEGHFGAVYLAEGQVPARDGRPAKHRRVAIKQLRGDWSMAAFETLVHEFELLDRVKHRSLCKQYDFLDREAAVVMEHVAGATLREVLQAFERSGEKIWPEAAIEIGCELADCLVQAHSTSGPDHEPLGLVHRDIKPENVMLTPSGEVKLLDFGLASVARDTSDVGIKGTPLYMAPEQAMGMPVTHRTDLFAVGLVLFELLTGEAVYPLPTDDRDSAVDALMRRIELADVRAALRPLLGSLPELGSVVATCLEADPARRPADGHALLLELRACRGLEARGALAEFCSYAFGPSGPLACMMLRTERGHDPAERQPSMSRNPEPPRPARSPPRSGAPRPGPGGTRPRPQAASRPVGRPAAGGKMWTPPEKPAAPPATSATPPGEALRMVPLHHEDDDPEIGRGPHQSSTQFFALPKPRVPDEVTPLRKVDPIAAASQPAGPPPGMGHHGGMVPPGAVPPGHLQPMAPIGIQGPIAGGSIGGYAMPPGAQLPPDPSSEMHRAQSYRVFAIVIGLMFMVFTVLAVTVTLTVYGIYWFDQQPEKRDGDLTMAPVPPQPPVDTGVKVAPPPPPVAQPVRPNTPAGPKPKPKPEPEPAPAADPAAVTLTLQPGSPPFTSVEIKCPSGFRERGDFVGGKATVANVPREDCEALFKGGPPAKTRVTGGDGKSCSFVGGNAANCR